MNERLNGDVPVGVPLRKSAKTRTLHKAVQHSTQYKAPHRPVGIYDPSTQFQTSPQPHDDHHKDTWALSLMENEPTCDNDHHGTAALSFNPNDLLPTNPNEMAHDSEKDQLETMRRHGTHGE